MTRLYPFILVCLGACIQPATSSSGSGAGTDSSSFGCHEDSDCPEVCARDGECLPASQVELVHVTWTLSGAAASATTCASSPDLDITFGTSTGSFGFSPVPCVEGKFTIDKIPTRYVTVSLFKTDSDYGAVTTIDRTRSAVLDLPY